MIRLLVGDCRDVLKTLPDNSVHCCVTSPPYWGLRSYLPRGHDLKHLEIGSEPTPEAFVETMVQVFREVRRVLHPSGTCWLNLGDSYASDTKSDNRTPEQRSKSSTLGPKRDGLGGDNSAHIAVSFGARKVKSGLKPKDLCMIPWRVALALQADGWWLRSVICWHKKSCMPESVTDRPTNSWEPIFLLAKSQRYFYDAEAVKEEGEGYGRSDWKQQQYKGGDPYLNHGGKGTHGTGGGSPTYQGGRNQRNVWSLGPEPYSEAHFATFPTEIPKRAILAGTSEKGCCPKCLAPWERVVERIEGKDKSWSQSEGPSDKHSGRIAQGLSSTKSGFNKGSKEDYYANQPQSRTVGWQPTCKCDAGEPIPCTVLDPFGGAGTTGLTADRLQRNAIMIELNDAYADLTENRIRSDAGMFVDISRL